MTAYGPRTVMKIKVGQAVSPNTAYFFAAKAVGQVPDLPEILPAADEMGQKISPQVPHGRNCPVMSHPGADPRRVWNPPHGPYGKKYAVLGGFACPGVWGRRSRLTIPMRSTLPPLAYFTCRKPTMIVFWR